MVLTVTDYGTAIGGVFQYPFNIKWDGANDWYETVLTITSDVNTLGTVSTVTGDTTYFEVPPNHSFTIGTNYLTVKFKLPASPLHGTKSINISFPSNPDIATLTCDVYSEYKLIWGTWNYPQYTVRMWSWAYGAQYEGADVDSNLDIELSDVEVIQEHDPYECTLIPTTTKVMIAGNCKKLYNSIIANDLTSVLSDYNSLPVRHTELVYLEVYPIPFTTVTYPMMYIKQSDVKKSFNSDSFIYEFNFTDGLDRLASVNCFMDNPSSPYNRMAYGFVRALTVTNCGNGYSGDITITLPYSSGDVATYTATITHGAITDVVIVTGGTFYNYSDPNAEDRTDCAVTGSVSGSDALVMCHLGGMPFLATTTGYDYFNECLYWFARNAVGATESVIIGYDLNRKKIETTDYGEETSFNSPPNIASMTWVHSAIGSASLGDTLRDHLRTIGAILVGDYTGFTWRLKTYDDGFLGSITEDPIGVSDVASFDTPYPVIDLVAIFDNESPQNCHEAVYNEDKPFPKGYLDKDNNVIKPETAIEIKCYGRTTETNIDSYEYLSLRTLLYYGTLPAAPWYHIYFKDSYGTSTQSTAYGVKLLHSLFKKQREVISVSTPTDFDARTDGIHIYKDTKWTIDGDELICVPIKIKRNVKSNTEDIDLMVLNR